MSAEPARHRWTVEDIDRMLEAGVLREDDPLELIDGELYTTRPQGPAHSMTTVRVRRRLERAFGVGFYVQSHAPVLAGPRSLPEPDVAVVREPERFDRHPGPDEVPLIVELSATSQAWDRSKAAIYAAAGFPEYWNLDLEARRLTVYRDPRPAHREYGRIEVLREGEAVAAGGDLVEVTELLPPSG